MIDWALAACAGRPSAIWFPQGTVGRTGRVDWSRPRAICDACPIEAGCLDWHLEHESAERHGMVGGKTPDERHALARARRKATR